MTIYRNQIKTIIMDLAELSREDLIAMWNLSIPHPDCSFAEFQQKLEASCSHVFLYRSKINGEILGFTALHIQNTILNSGKKVRTIRIGWHQVRLQLHHELNLSWAMWKLGWKLTLQSPFLSTYYWLDLNTIEPYVFIAEHAQSYYPSRLKPMSNRVWRV